MLGYFLIALVVLYLPVIAIHVSARSQEEIDEIQEQLEQGLFDD